jgi:NAD(P)-dependent dehydrogenase (short-subunit alcohol dehydrogenase family)
MLRTIRRIWPQLFPSASSATLTEANLPPQTGNVVIITGSTSGLGREMARILYQAGATVYVAARNKEKAEATIRQIEEQTAKKTKETTTSSAGAGTLKYLYLDLDDLRTVKPCAEAFLADEKRLDLLFNNAGLSNQPPSRRTVQGLERQLGVNCVGHYLFTKLLTPVLVSTVQDPNTPPNSVRVIFPASMLVDVLAPAEGFVPEELDNPHRDQNRNYAISKAACWMIAARLAKQLGPKGVVCISENPGNLVTSIWEETSRFIFWSNRIFMYQTIHGTHTMLWAGLSPDITVADGGRCAIPWGRWHPDPRPELLEAIKDEDEGGKGYSKILEEWCEKVTLDYQ